MCRLPSRRFFEMLKVLLLCIAQQSRRICFYIHVFIVMFVRQGAAVPWYKRRFSAVSVLCHNSDVGGEYVRGVFIITSCAKRVIS